MGVCPVRFLRKLRKRADSKSCLEGTAEMILYFTGTGNSRYIAQRIAKATGDTLVSMNDKIKQHDTKPIHGADRLVFVVPTYGWRIPRIVEQWIQETQFTGAVRAWFVMSCGGEIGNAAQYIRSLCAQKGFAYMGTAQVVMPENYIAMFNAPERGEAEQIIENAAPVIDAAAQAIVQGKEFPPPRNNLYDRLMSGAVNPLFYRLFVKADGFHVDERCVGCGNCVELCPLNNITLQEERPVWGKNCTHCMACICLCPEEAIEYKKKSVGKPRYHCGETDG